MLNLLHNIIVQPLIYIFEFCYSSLGYNKDFSPIAIIATISFVVFALCLPFYIRAEKLSNEEREIQKRLSKKVKSIKKNFTGDERHLLLQTYYRQNNYHPIMALRLSLSLFLQVPIFIAAYEFFTNLNVLEYQHFWRISCLALPDQLLDLGFIKINVLPFLMTFINLIAGFVYTKSLKLKDNKLLIIVSLVFLCLLYNSPAGLLLYWTFNNCFSLLKNLCLKFSSEKFLIRCVFIYAIAFYPSVIYSEVYKSFVILYGILLVLGFFLFVKNSFVEKLNFSSIKLYYCCMLGLWTLLGFLIPSNVVATSPIEFLFNNKLVPLKILSYPVILYFGYFLVWGSCFFYILKPNEKKIMSLFTLFFFITSILNLYYWKMPGVPLQNTLIFESGVLVFEAGSLKNIILYALISVFIAAIIILLTKKKTLNKYLYGIIFVLIISITSAVVINYTKIYTAIANHTFDSNISVDKNNFISLSRTKKNVVIIFLDRAINSYFPIILKDHPELKEKYKGFVYYPNTLSYAQYTMMGYLPILGGYEYSPIELNKINKPFIEKYNDAISMLPTVFANMNYETSVINPSNEGWTDFTSPKAASVFKNNPAYQNKKIKLKKIVGISSIKNSNIIISTNVYHSKRNMLYFSLLSVSQPYLRNLLYFQGNYHRLNSAKNPGYTMPLVNSYSELEQLPLYSNFNSNENTFHLLNNNLTHEQTILLYPDYTLECKTEDKECANNESASKENIESIFGKGNKSFISHYHVNAAALILVGKYLDFLKENGVYDNTKIIIVSDHGTGMSEKSPTFSEFQSKNLMPFNPILLVKDFNSKGEIITDESLMSNADVPTLALKDVTKNPINPFTGKVINSEFKKKGIYIKNDGKWHPEDYLFKDNFIYPDTRFINVKYTEERPIIWEKIWK